MRLKSMLMIALFAMGFFHALFGQDVKVDLTEIDTGTVIVKTMTVVDTSSTDSVVEKGWKLINLEYTRVIHPDWCTI